MKENSAAELFVWDEAYAWSTSGLTGPACWHGNLPLAEPLLEDPYAPTQKTVVFVELVNQAECLVDAVSSQILELLPSVLKVSAQPLVLFQRSPQRCVR